MVNDRVEGRVICMANDNVIQRREATKRVPTSRMKYGKSHPTVSCRISKEVYDRLKKICQNENKTTPDPAKLLLWHRLRSSLSLQRNLLRFVFGSTKIEPAKGSYPTPEYRCRCNLLPRPSQPGSDTRYDHYSRTWKIPYYSEGNNRISWPLWTRQADKIYPRLCI